MRLAVATILALLIAACGNQSQTASPPPPAPQAPAAPATTAAPNTEAQPEPAQGPQSEADYITFENGLRVFPAARRAEMHAVLLGNQSRPLEFLVVAPGGAIHEALFATGVKGEHLKRALELIGLTEAEIKRSGRGYLDPPLGDKVRISVRFAHRVTGKLTVVPVENWLTDLRTDKRPEAGGWVFTGSHEQYDAELNRSRNESDMKGNLIATWRDSSCVIDNARPSGAVADCYSPFPGADGIPEEQSEVVLIFEPWRE